MLVTHSLDTYKDQPDNCDNEGGISVDVRHVLCHVLHMCISVIYDVQCLSYVIMPLVFKIC